MYLKDRQDINVNNLNFEEPLPETRPLKFLLYSKKKMPGQIKTMQTTGKGYF